MQRVLAVLFTLFGIGVMWLRDDIAFAFGLPNYNQRGILLIGFASIGYGISLFMLLYLRGEISFKFLDGTVSASRSRSDESAALSRTVLDAVAEVKSQVEKLKSAQANALGTDREELVRAVSATLSSDLTQELEGRFAAHAIETERLKSIRRSFDLTVGRLEMELASLARRGNLNLVIGSITTAIAVGLLIYMLLTTKLDPASVTSILAYYIPRVSVVIFIEVFAFFFLRLYKSTLHEIRLYQLDLNSLAVCAMAVESAWASTDLAAKGGLAKQLLASLPSRASDADAAGTEKIDPKKLADLLQAFTSITQGKGGG
ncbi:MAG: hypothetical protein ACTHMK_04625 [Dyella sp.]|uniref:hypothetical protein n=1 Tax=Dyella sp. TaxID=1869338 RepID=UPI003F7EAA96